MASIPSPIPRSRPTRPYARVEGLRALATFVLLTGFVAVGLPQRAWDTHPGLVLSAEGQRGLCVAGLATALVLFAWAAHHARALRRGSASSGSPRLARALTLACGIGTWALVLAPFALHGSVDSDGRFMTILLVASIVVASVFTRIGLEDPSRDERRVPSATIVGAFRDGGAPPA